MVTGVCLISLGSSWFICFILQDEQVDVGTGIALGFQCYQHTGIHYDISMNMSKYHQLTKQVIKRVLNFNEHGTVPSSQLILKFMYNNNTFQPYRKISIMTGTKRVNNDAQSVLSSNKKGKISITDFFKIAAPTTNKRSISTSTTKIQVVANEEKENVEPKLAKQHITVSETIQTTSITTTATTTTSKFTNDFDKAKWVNSLTPEQKHLLQLEIDTMDESWLALLHKELTKTYFLNLKKFLKSQWNTNGLTIFPPKEDIYSWTRLTPVDKVKVVVVGQDPYHNFNQAHGLAFSVKDPKTRIPPSLLNIYKCLKIDYPDFEIPKTADLTRWSSQGVLLLNTCLTVKAHNANSHSKKGWEEFTTMAIRKVIEYHNKTADQGIVVIAWGSPAQKTINNIGLDMNKNCFLKSVHPSPLSASRGFFDCKHFKKCNEWLLEHYGSNALIDWSIVDGSTIKEIRDKKLSSE
ncbi:unnamed protein product [[Candida] boidinii]|uniref:Uracil-DNA glycosylase n=1 Tax=Candida boidinii TaxID=5477 RepID=A0A9W6WHV7_CANBO|nr:unnamed protein product [[Candida] boidinii]GMF49805.1 unnamed protein product [[Candida] boidinii]